MKRLLCIALAALMLFGLAACGEDQILSEITITYNSAAIEQIKIGMPVSSINASNPPFNVDFAGGKNGGEFELLKINEDNSQYEVADATVPGNYRLILYVTLKDGYLFKMQDKYETDENGNLFLSPDLVIHHDSNMPEAIKFAVCHEYILQDGGSSITNPKSPQDADMCCVWYDFTVEAQ